MIPQPLETRPSLGQLVTEHQKMVWRYGRVLGAEASLADDLTQETFLTLVHRPMEYRGKAAAAAYLRLVAKSRFISEMRKLGRQPNKVALEVAESQWVAAFGDEGEIDTDAGVEAIRRCVERLPEDAKRAVKLRYQEEAGREEIGKALGMTSEGVKSLLRRSRRALRHCVEQALKKESAAMPRGTTPDW
ncbi:MAG: sigma-70 family RNA polymerase sigma factor [Planctomycetes bacterium]|nr:sigma-70 family RNA polymerase sigma factor [Planctomycetota bacterium]